MIALDKFERLTKFPIRDFFNRYGDFVNRYYQRYIDYFKGTASLDRACVTLLHDLINDSYILEDLFNLNKESFSEDISYWVIYEHFIDVYLKLQTIVNTPKWVRASYTDTYNRKTTVNYMLKQGQTLEQLVADFGYDFPDEDWVAVSVQNKLKEIDYDLSGGNNLSISFDGTERYELSSVVDIMVGDNILGKDLFNDLTIQGEDLQVLTPHDTLYQSADILLNLIKGNSPEFPKDGIFSVAGSNINSIRYPSIFRELVNSFYKDDTFKGLEFIDINIDQDAVTVQVKLVSIINDIIEQNIYLNE